MSSFVGRYLNAARLGPGKLNEHLAHEGALVPNACEKCDFRDPVSRR